MDTMDCTQARYRLSEYQDGALETAAEAELAAHWGGCGDCAAVAGSLAAVRERLRDLSPETAPPELIAGVLAGIGAEGRNTGGGSAPPGADAPKSVLSPVPGPLPAAAGPPPRTRGGAGGRAPARRSRGEAPDLDRGGPSGGAGASSEHGLREDRSGRPSPRTAGGWVHDRGIPSVAGLRRAAVPSPPPLAVRPVRRARNGTGTPGP